MSLLSALCLALLAVGSYGQIGSHSSQYTPYSVPLQGGGYAGYIKPNYYYGSNNYNQYRPDQGYGYGLNQQQLGFSQQQLGLNQQQPGLSSQSYLPYSYVLNLQSDRVAGSQSQISTPLADVREQQIQPQLVSPRYLVQPPAYSGDRNVQPLGSTPNTLLLIPVSDSLSGYNYGTNNPYGSQLSVNPYGNLGYGSGNLGYGNPNLGYGNPNLGYGYGYRPVGTQSSTSNVHKRKEPAQIEEESARAETTDNNAKTE